MTDAYTGKMLTKEDTEGIYEDWSATIVGFDGLAMSEYKNQNLEMGTCSPETIQELIDGFDVDN